jgi:hypothetical protein
LVQIHVEGELARKSTKQRNDKVARQIESAHRTSLAKSEVGTREKKIVPTLAEYVRSRFLPWAESVFAAKPKTWLGIEMECAACFPFRRSPTCA